MEGVPYYLFILCQKRTKKTWLYWELFVKEEVVFNGNLFLEKRVPKKLSFTELSISRFVTNIISISSQLEAESRKAQFGKTQFFWGTLNIPILFFSKEKMINPGGQHSRVYIRVQLLDQREGGGQRPQHWRWDHGSQVFIEGQLRSISEAGRYIQFRNSSVLSFGRAY